MLLLYDKYRDPQNPDQISIDGTLAYLDDLGVAPEDCRSLTLAFLLELPQTGEFSRTKFLGFWAAHRISSIDAMRLFLDESHALAMLSPPQFEALYQFCFDFVRGLDSRIKSISYDDAILYWQLLYGENRNMAPAYARLLQWYEFLELAKKPVSRDLWCMFHKFVVQVVVDDPELLAAYDEMSSWPSAVDEYYEWLVDSELLVQKET